MCLFAKSSQQISFDLLFFGFYVLSWSTAWYRFILPVCLHCWVLQGAGKWASQRFCLLLAGQLGQGLGSRRPRLHLAANRKAVLFSLALLPGCWVEGSLSILEGASTLGWTAKRIVLLLAVSVRGSVESCPPASIANPSVLSPLTSWYW